MQACMHKYMHTDIPTDVGTHICACLPKYIPVYTLCLPHTHTELWHAHVYDVREIERHRGIARWPPSGNYRKDTDDLRSEGDFREEAAVLGSGFRLGKKETSSTHPYLGSWSEDFRLLTTVRMPDMMNITILFF